MYKAHGWKKSQTISVRFFVLLDKRQLTEWFFSIGLGKTKAGQPLKIFMSKVAEIVTLVSILSFEVLGYIVPQYLIFLLPLNCYQVCFSPKQLGFSKQRIVFMGVEVSIFTSLNISKNKRNNVDFCSKIQLVEDFFKLLVDYFTI